MSPEWIAGLHEPTRRAQCLLTRRARSAEMPGQELFIFNKETDGKFNIARYSFTTINPQKG